MSVEKEAGVRVKVTGEQDVAQAASRISSAWGEVGTKATAAFKGLGSAVNGAVQGVLNDLGHVVTAAGAISFAGSVQSVEKFEDSIGRLATASRSSFSSAQAGINSLAQEIGEMPSVTEAWVSSVGQLTYSYDRAGQSAKAMQGFALQTGQSIQQVSALAVMLDQVGAGGDKAGKALGVMTAQAKMLDTIGGPKALADTFQHLSGEISQLANQDLAKTTALLAGFGGSKGFTPQQRERALGRVMSSISADPELVERGLGLKSGSLTDEYGHMKDPTAVMEELQRLGKKGGGYAKRLEYTVGREAAAAIMHTDFAAVRDAEKAQASADGDHALARFKDAPPGRRHDAEIRKDVAMQGAVGYDSALGKARQEMLELSAEHPLAVGVGMPVATNLVGQLWNKAGNFLTGAGGVAVGAKAMAAKAAGGAAAGAEEIAAPSVAAGLGLSGMAAGGTLLAGVLATGKTLMELGDASSKKQGYSNKDLTKDEAAALSAKAHKAGDEAFANMSPGMQAAYEAESARKNRDASARAAAAAGAPAPGKGPAVSPEMLKALQDLVAAGKLNQQAVAEALANNPIQIEIVNPTGAELEARVRGQQ